MAALGRFRITAVRVRYSWRTILGALRRAGVRTARFLPTYPLPQLTTLNLRNHRKLLVVDGRLGFAGGMNIRVVHWLGTCPRIRCAMCSCGLRARWWLTCTRRLRMIGDCATESLGC